MTICSRCGASNPETNKFCGDCGQVIGPVAPSPSATSPHDLPAWLQTPADPTTASTAAQRQSSPPPADLPSWLSDMGVEDESPTSASQTETPDWLAQLQQSTPAPAVDAAPDDLPAWLRSDTPPTSPSPSASTGSDDLPAWLRDDTELSTGPATSHDTQATSDWLSSPASSVPTSGPETSSTADELPEWLRQDAGEPASSTGGGSSSPTANWLAEPGHASTGVESSLQPSAEADELPPWLRDDAAGSTTTPLFQPPVNAPGDVPPWLNDYEAPSTPAPAPATDMERLPAWLNASDELTPTVEHGPGVLSPGSGADSGLPPWLNDDAPGANAATAANAELPSWLADEQPTAAAEPSRSSMPSWLEDKPAASAPASDIDVPLPDWGSEFGETPSPVSPMATVGGDELPAWLSDETGAASNTSSPTRANGASAVPTWLMEESPTAPTAAPETVAWDETPSWLAGDPGSSNSTASMQQATGDANELPPWLENDGDTSYAANTSAASSTDRSTTQELPTWLLDEPLPVDQNDAPPAQGAATNDQLPPWLQATDEPLSALPPGDAPSWIGLPDAPATEDHTAQIYTSSENDGLPDWLNASDSTPAATTTQSNAASSEPSAVAPARGSADTVQLPAWLAEADQTEPTASTNSAATTDLPPWLSDLQDQPASAPQPTSGLPAWLEDPDQPAAGDQANAEQSELLGGLDLPAWLRNDSAAKPAAPVVEAAPKWLERVDQEAEEPAPPAAVVEAPAVRPVVRTPERIASMQLLDQLLVQPAPEPAPQVAQRRRSRVLAIVLALIALLIIGAVLTVLLSNRFGLNFGAAPGDTPVVAGAAQLMAALPPNRPVVLAYEWDAQRLGELRPLEDVIVGQLAGRKDVPLMFVSTDPQGALLASERVAQLEALNDQYHLNGLGYANLGFKAGGSLALRRFANNARFGSLFAQDASGINLQANDVTMESMCGGPTADACSWDNVSLLVIMADDVDDVRGWFEQVRSEHLNLQTLVLAPAEIAPQVQPYAAAPNVILLAGLRDAEMYVRTQGSANERLGRQVDAVAIGNVIFAAAVVVGGIPALVMGQRGRRAEADVVEGRVWDR